MGLRIFALLTCSAALAGLLCQDASGQEQNGGSTLPSDPQPEARIPPVAADSVSPDGVADEERSLLNEESFRDIWKHYSSRPNVPLDEVWKLVLPEVATEPELVCTGDPQGFLYTVEQYSDFTLSFEWKYPEDPNGNSGILVFTQDDRRLWPTSIQVQLHNPKAGSVFPSGDATSQNTSDASGLAEATNTWNRCIITSTGGIVAVTVNDKKVGEVAGCNPSEGSIAIQSEGSVVHFRRMKVVRMPGSVAGATSRSTSSIDRR